MGLAVKNLGYAIAGVVTSGNALRPQPSEDVGPANVDRTLARAICFKLSSANGDAQPPGIDTETPGGAPD